MASLLSYILATFLILMILIINAFALVLVALGAVKGNFLALLAGMVILSISIGTIFWVDHRK